MVVVRREYKGNNISPLFSWNKGKTSTQNPSALDASCKGSQSRKCLLHPSDSEFSYIGVMATSVISEIANKRCKLNKCFRLSAAGKT